LQIACRLARADVVFAIGDQPHGADLPVKPALSKPLRT
jgi:hypothetical protein